MVCSPLHWRHNDDDSVSYHQPHGYLLDRLFRRRSKKTSKPHVTGLCVGNSPGPVNSPHKWPVTRKMFPFDDVIMCSAPSHASLFTPVETHWNQNSDLSRYAALIWLHDTNTVFPGCMIPMLKIWRSVIRHLCTPCTPWKRCPDIISSECTSQQHIVFSHSAGSEHKGCTKQCCLGSLSSNNCSDSLSWGIVCKCYKCCYHIVLSEASIAKYLSKVSPESKKSNMAARRPFWKWRRWKSIGSYPYI